MAERKKVTVLDYGSGNVRSAVRALEAAGAEVTLSAKPDDILNCDGLFVPGVGAYAAVMQAAQRCRGHPLDRTPHRRRPPGPWHLRRTPDLL